MENKKSDPHDDIFEDELTEERNATPVAREEAAHTEKLDPQSEDQDEARKLIKGEKGRSVR